jgi:hypothetical protein
MAAYKLLMTSAGDLWNLFLKAKNNYLNLLNSLIIVKYYTK